MIIYKIDVNKENNIINIIISSIIIKITGLKLDYQKTLRVSPRLRSTYFIQKIKEGQKGRATLEKIA